MISHGKVTRLTNLYSHQAIYIFLFLLGYEDNGKTREIKQRRRKIVKKQ